MSLRSCFPVALGIFLVQLLVAGVSHAQPANDDCSQAIPITDGTYAGTNIAASNDGYSNCWDNNGYDVWYLYTATCTGVL
jgi:hypothetical protein